MEEKDLNTQSSSPEETDILNKEEAAESLSQETAPEESAYEETAPEKAELQEAASEEISLQDSHDPESPTKWSRAKKIIGTVLAMIPPFACLGAILLCIFKTLPEGTAWNSTYNIHFAIMCVLLTGSVLLGYFRPKIYGVVGWVVWALAPAGAMLMAEWILRNPFDGKMTTPVIFLNIAVYYIVSLLTLFLTRRTWLSTIITTAIPILYSIINHYVMAFRGNALFPWDFQSISTAMSVASNYTFDFGFVLALVVVTFIVVYQLAYYSRVKIMKSKVKMCVSFILALIPAWMLFSYAQYMQTDEVVSKYRLYPYLFTPNTVYTRNGIAASFFFSLQFMGVDKPADYDADRVEELLAVYGEGDEGETDTPATVSKTSPNIIAIMNEAYSDLSVLGDFEILNGENPMPVTSQLVENTVKGQMYVSVVGGNTANSEYEFLCSASMAFLPPGSVAYQQFLKHETPSLVSHLESLGYLTAAMHPYGASGWDRNKVYPLLGFDESYFLPDFKGDERIRGYVSDRATYNKIIELYEDNTTDSPMFIFDVTMQNHGGYTTVHEDFTHNVLFKNMAYNSAISQYLSLVQESERAFGELIEYFSDAEEPTVILMFGDHQPGDNVVQPIYTFNGEKMYTGNIEWDQKRNIVPFFIWANYDIEEDDDVVISANYLSTLLCQTAGVELSNYQKYLSDLREEYPVVNANCFVNKAGVFHPISELENETALVEYQMIHYNQLVDYKNRAASLNDLTGE